MRAKSHLLLFPENTALTLSNERIKSMQMLEKEGVKIGRALLPSGVSVCRKEKAHELKIWQLQLQ